MTHFSIYLYTVSNFIQSQIDGPLLYFNLQLRTKGKFHLFNCLDQKWVLIIFDIYIYLRLRPFWSNWRVRDNGGGDMCVYSYTCVFLLVCFGCLYMCVDIFFGGSKRWTFSTFFFPFSTTMLSDSCPYVKDGVGALI